MSKAEKKEQEEEEEKEGKGESSFLPDKLRERPDGYQNNTKFDYFAVRRIE